MDERQFYTEKEESRKVKLICPSCRGEFEAPVRWKVCRKKKELPRGIGEEDKKKFAKASSYMVRLDDLVACYKCRKRFELTGQSTVLINDNLGDPNADPENFGNRRYLLLNLRVHLKKCFDGLVKRRFNLFLCAFDQVHGDARCAAVLQDDRRVLHFAQVLFR